MQIHSLNLEDFCEDNYTLIGIHTTLEDFKLAYLLNNTLKTKFYRASDDLDFETKKNNAFFSVFNYKNTTYDFDWFLISNTCNQEKNIVLNNELFNTETRTYLIPEKKNVDFFIKIMGNIDTYFVNKVINNIKKIPNIITSYSIDFNTLKSKNSLII